MEEQSNEVLNESVAVTENPDTTAQSAQEEAVVQPQEESTPTTDAAQPQEETAAAQPTEAEPVAESQASDDKQDKKKKKGKKKDKKPEADAVADADSKPKKENKVGAYVKALFKYFNIITVLPFALLMYAVFFASYIVDKGKLFESNLTWICVIMGIGAAIMVAWFIVTFKKRRVCSFDAFLLMALMICASMIAQCIIFKNFASFDGISIATLAATVAILALLTVRLIMFSPEVQRNHSDKSYKAKSKLSMYFTVIFTKYAFFIAMLCVIGALLILILTQSSIFEDFEFVATTTEKAVTMVFAGLAAILMIVGIFIRIVRGRANVIDCMPYMLFLVTIGSLIYFIQIKEVIYMTLYIAIGCAVIGAAWLALCLYTLLVSNYKQVQVAEETAGVTDGDAPAAEPTAETQAIADDTQPVVESTPTTDATPTETATADKPTAAATDAPTETAVPTAEATPVAAPTEESVAPTETATTDEAKPATEAK
ncbi:MAG: hypothetical protein K2I23_05040 [Clostridia bacterium]|nr:hypothetical protein [Clostridia bacterium]